MPAMQSWGKFIFTDASTCPWQKLVTQDMDSEWAWPPGLTFARLPVHLVGPYQAFASALQSNKRQKGSKRLKPQTNKQTV
jgi:hypothetical protein